jgi:ketosteroid isomerase-like protein
MARSDALLPKQPEDWPRAFAHHVNQGDVEAALALYADSASIVGPADRTSTGIDAIRARLIELVRTTARMEGRVVRSVRSDGIAMLYTDWDRTARDAPAPRIEQHRAIEILRQEADGTWRLIIGDPDGRDGLAGPARG